MILIIFLELRKEWFQSHYCTKVTLNGEHEVFNFHFVVISAQHHGSIIRGRQQLIFRSKLTLWQRRLLELRGMPSSSLQPPTPSSTPVAGRPGRLWQQRGLGVRNVGSVGDLRQHGDPRLSHSLRRYLPQRRSHSRVGSRPRHGSARCGCHDFQVS